MDPTSRQHTLNTFSDKSSNWPWTGEVNPAIYSKKNDWPKISIITPSFNQGKYIEETIRSIVCQNYPNLEYIIIDGGSTDNTYKVIEKYKNRIHYYISEKDDGQAAAIQKGLKLCTGDIFNWINSDDYLTENALYHIGLRLNENGKILAGTVFNFEERETDAIQGYTGVIHNTNLSLKKYFTINGGFFFHQPGIWYGKNFIKKIKLNVASNYCFDTEMLLDLLETNPNIIYTKEVLVNFRLHENSKTIKKTDGFISELIQIHKKYEAHSNSNISTMLKRYNRKIKWMNDLNELGGNGISQNEKFRFILKGIINDPLQRLNRFSLGALKKSFSLKLFIKKDFINLLYRHPKSSISHIMRFGGPVRYLKMLRNKELMKISAKTLKPVLSYSDGLPLYFLTGKNYLYQTLYCIASLNCVSKEKFRFHLVDDGTFNQTIIQQIEQQLPGATIISKSMIKNNLEQHLPEEKYPYLHQKRREYPHIKKLTDIHTVPGLPWKLVLDSDMLFWNEPDEIISWLKNPAQPIHMIDCEQSYGYSDELMKELSHSNIPPLINVGAIGLNSEQINWEELERWAQILEEREGCCYYLEQALSAMLIGERKSIILTRAKYIVNPNKDSILAKHSILHHYVDLSKNEYFKFAWKAFI